MSDSTDRVFAHALNTVKRIPRTGSARPPPAARLKLYGLYKQSMEGDVEGVMRRPEGLDTVAQAETEKWEAWHAHQGLSRTAAKRAYISTLIETMHKYASSTPEARELVAELEFVWDQIRANSASSGETSPGTREYEKQQVAQMSYEGLGSTRMGQVDEGARLRELRPFSEGDEDEEEGEEGDFGDRGGFARYQDPNTNEEVALAVGEGRNRDYDVRNRKWRKRIEMALFKMATEIAALREQIEAKKIGGLHTRRGGAWKWIRWLIWIAIRQIFVDTLLVGIIFLWARRKNDQKIEQGLWLILTAVKEQLRQMKVLRSLQLPSLI